MNATRSLHVILASAAALVVGAACGTSTTTENAQPVVPGDELAAVSPTTLADDVERAWTAPPTTVAPEPEPEPAPEPEPEPAPEPQPATEPEPAPCGEFGAIPPRPDSMPTLMYDTDGDGAADDEVTAYGAADAWRIRVVEDGVTSEVPLPAIAGFAFLNGSDRYDVHTELPRLIDAETEIEYVVGTVSGCLELIETVPPWTGDEGLAAEDFGCGTFGPVADTAVIVSDLAVDILADGTADDRLVSYNDGGDWRLRSVIGGIVSEISISGVGPHSVEVLGLADVGAVTGGTELLATTGGGASTVEIGVFGWSEGSCLLQHHWEDGSPLGFFVGGTATHGDSTWCGTGYIGSTGYELEEDGTYYAWSAAFEEKAVGVWGYMMSSDDFSEGLAYDELGPLGLDCFGLSV